LNDRGIDIDEREDTVGAFYDGEHQIYSRPPGRDIKGNIERALGVNKGWSFSGKVGSSANNQPDAKADNDKRNGCANVTVYRKADQGTSDTNDPADISKSKGSTHEVKGSTDDGKSQWAFDPDEYIGPDVPVHFVEGHHSDGSYEKYIPPVAFEDMNNWDARLPWV
jgi:hypothetical protein